MNEPEHAAKNQPETKPAHDEVARKAYAIYEKEGRPQGHARQNWSEAEAQLQQSGSDHSDHPEQHDHHANMAADFRKRFWISLVLTLPLLVLSPMLQKLVGLREAFRFPGDLYVQFGFASAVFWYGAWPFLKGIIEEIESRRLAPTGGLDLISGRKAFQRPFAEEMERLNTSQDVYLGKAATMA